jgi:hypothetical protein
VTQQNQTIDPTYFKNLQMIAHLSEQLFNKDVQIGQHVAQIQGLQQAHHQLSETNKALTAEVTNLKAARDGENKVLRPAANDAPEVKPPEPQAAPALPPTPAPTPAPSADNSSATSETAESGGGEA